MVKKCQTDSHLKRAQSCLSDIKSLGLLLVVLKQTLNWSLSARRNFECCTFSKKPIEKFVSFFNKLQNPTKVQAIQNRDRENLEYMYHASKRQHKRFKTSVTLFLLCSGAPGSFSSLSFPKQELFCYTDKHKASL